MPVVIEYIEEIAKYVYCNQNDFQRHAENRNFNKRNKNNFYVPRKKVKLHLMVPEKWS